MNEQAHRDQGPARVPGHTHLNTVFDWHASRTDGRTLLFKITGIHECFDLCATRRISMSLVGEFTSREGCTRDGRLATARQSSADAPAAPVRRVVRDATFQHKGS